MLIIGNANYPVSHVTITYTSRQVFSSILHKHTHTHTQTHTHTHTHTNTHTHTHIYIYICIYICIYIYIYIYLYICIYIGIYTEKQWKKEDLFPISTHSQSCERGPMSNY